MAAHPHLSIGEVLSLLQDEFPDVTISKIRFLESQGLVDPERTPSGYRKFYDVDIERLRWVLRQQRDAFLPLKVIKGRLEEHSDLPLDDEVHDLTTDGLGGVGAPGSGPDGDDARDVAPGAGVLSARVEHGLRASPTEAPAQSGAPGPPMVVPAPAPGAAGAYSVPAAPAARTPADRTPAGGARPGAGTGDGSTGLGGTANGTPDQAAAGTTQLFDVGPPFSAYGSAGSTAPPGHRSAVASARPGRRPAPEGAGAPQRAPTVASPGARPGEARQGQKAPPGDRGDRGSRPGGRRPLGVGTVPDEDELALEELVSVAGVDVGTVRDLERYGLITPRVVGGTTYYAPEAAVIARLASAFARHGVEARHLRAYKGAVEREAGIVQQVIMPLIRQRNPEARLAAAQAAEELSTLGGELRAALLRSALADLR